jgi:chitodextrinase/lysophospholipase L1-like esterase
MMRVFSTVFCVFLLFAQSVSAQWVTNYRHGVKYNQNEGSNGPKLNTHQYELRDSTFSYRESTAGGPTWYYDRTGWNSDPYTQGHLMRTQTNPNQFKQNYRLLFPGGADSSKYDENYEGGYPLIVMMHGAGERGNCWNNNCYFSDKNWEAETNSPAIAGPSTSPDLLNNDHNLVHGGKPHLDAVNRAGSKFPNDPTLAYNAFPGFVLFPQNLNGWNGSEIRETIRIIHKIIETHNIDRNRVVVHGLSNGAQHVVTLVKNDPALFAGVLLMSPSASNTKVRDSYELAHIPFWVFQGGKDNNPSPSETNSLVRYFEEMGGSIELTYYDNLGHGTWNAAYGEDNFFPWIKSKDKSDIHVYFQDSTICASNGQGAKLGVSWGFQAYQWERDGEIINGADSSVYFADIPGVYRCRFSRFEANPTEADWNKWSKPVTIRESVVSKPIISALNTVHLPDINGVDSVSLQTELNSNLYYTWYKNGAIVGDTNFYNVKSAGVFTVATETLGGCPSADAESVNVTFNAPSTLSAPTNVTADLTTNNKIRLYWEDNSNEETAYEVYRSTSESGFYKFVALLPEDAISYLDNSVTSNDDYYYKLRAVAYDKVSPYTSALFVASGTDSEAPTTPSNLEVVEYSLTTANLSWNASTDNENIKEYIIYYGSDSIKTGSTNTSYTVSNLKEGRSFAFTVKAIDYAGNLSAASNQVNVVTIFEGLTYEHSTGAYNSLSEIDWSFVEYYGTVNNFGLSERTQDDYISFKFDGYVNITEAGDYRFRSRSDDGSRVFIGGFNPNDLDENLVNNNDGTHGCNVNQSYVTLSLAVGAYPITVIFFERGGGQCLSVEYSKDGGTWQTIPDEMLKSGTIVVNDPPVAPTNLQATSTGLSTIELDWDHTELIPDNTNIVVLGSSTAEGYGISPFDSTWVGRLDNWLGDNSSNYTLTNLAVGGFTTYHIRPDGSDNGSNAAVDTDHNITKALSLNPDYLIINLPSNNANLQIPADTTMAHYREIKALADQAGVKTFIVTPQPRDFGPSSPKRTVLMAELDSVREGFGDYVIDVFDSLADDSDMIEPSLAYGDGIHLNKDGHAYMFTEIRSKLLSYLTHFEIYRSNTSGSGFSLIGTTKDGSQAYTDLNLAPGVTYYYKLKAVNKNGTSVFSNELSATNSMDTQTPTVPSNLIVVNSTYTNSSFKWDASTDNDQVAYYEFAANDSVFGTSPDNTFYTTDFLPDSTYLVKVRAYDRSGNVSAYSSEVSVTSSQPTIYYSKSTGDLDVLATWGTNTDGTGTAPTNFALNGQIFRVANRSSTSMSNDWSVGGLISKVVVTEGETLSLNGNLNGKVQVENNGTIAVNGNLLPSFEESSDNSHIILNNFTQMPTGKFGSLTLSGTGTKTVGTNEVMVKGNLTIGNGITLKGSSNNGSCIIVKGDLDIQGTQGDVAQDNRIEIAFQGGKKHQLNTVGDLSLYRLTLNDEDTMEINSANPVNLIAGSQKGGGVRLGNNALLNVSNKALQLTGAAAFNAENNTGRIAINGGNMNFDISTASDSHLYFDADSNIVEKFEVNLTGAGDVVLEEELNLIAELNLTNGDLNANGRLVLRSDENGTAVIKELPTGAQINGNIQAERFMSATRAYRYTSAPVTGVTVADWQNYFPITGNFTGASTGPGLGTSASLYRFDESQGGWLAHPVSGTDNSAAIEPGVGYAPFIRDSNNDLIINNVGAPVQGEFSFNLTGGTGGGADDGWNLVANPYPATIQWDNTGWTSSGVSNIIAVAINGAGGSSSFLYYDRTDNTGTLPNGYIASGQGFWIQTLDQSPSLTITEQAKVASVDAPSANYYRSAEIPLVSHLKLSLKEISTGKIDQALVKFDNGGADDYNKREDGFKKPNTGINFYSLTDDSEQVAINTLSNEFCNKTVNLGMYNVQTGAYSIAFDNINEFNYARVELTDNLQNEVVTLTGTDAYSFSIDQNTPATFEDRFSLTFIRPDVNTTLSYEYENELCISDDAEILITNAQPGAVYSLFDEEGNSLELASTALSNKVGLHLPNSLLNEGVSQFSVKINYPGCDIIDASEPISVSISKPQTPEISKAVISGCEANVVRLQASGAHTNESYQWYDVWNDVILDHTSNTLELESLDDYMGMYEVRIISPLGCISDASVQLIIDSASFIPKALALQETVEYSSEICEGQTLDISLNNAQLGVEYSIINNNGNQISDWIYAETSELHLSITSSDIQTSDNFSLQARFPGCNIQFLESEINVSVNNLEKPTLSRVINETCDEKSVVLTAASNAASYNWYFEGFGNQLDQNTASISLNETEESGYYFVKAVSSIGCESDTYDSIFVSEKDLTFINVNRNLEVSYTQALCPSDLLNVEVKNPQTDFIYYLADETGIIYSSFVVASVESSINLQASNLQSVENSILKVMVKKDGCEALPLEQEVSFSIVDLLELNIEQTNYDACLGESLSIQIPELTNDGSVKWYDEDGNILADGKVFTFEIDEVDFDSRKLFVEAFNKLGCSNEEKVEILIETTALIKPELVFNDNILSVENDVEGEISWYFNDEFYSEAAEIELTEQGVYFAQLDFKGCLIQSDVFGFVITSNKVELNNENISIFPNPTNNFNFTIQAALENTSPIEVIVYDAFGRALYNAEFSNGDLKNGVDIDLSGNDQRPGIYVVTIRQDAQLATRKIIMK